MTSASVAARRAAFVVAIVACALCSSCGKSRDSTPSVASHAPAATTTAPAQAPAVPTASKVPSETPPAHGESPPAPNVAPSAMPAGSEHVAAEPSAACLAKTTDAPVPTSATIHRWVDASGVTHYSDQAPTSQVSGHRVLEVHGLPAVKVEASGYDVALPDDVQNRAIVDAVSVQRVFHDTLGIDGPSGTTLKIVFVALPDAYAKLVGDPELAASTGAYVPPQHTIYVRMQNDDEIAFAILRHEITHALIHERVGNLPVALNEGLAEYFRRYRAAGMGGQVDVAADHTALVAAAPADDGRDELVDLMALDGRAFYASDRDRRYLRAYALIALLMSDSAGTTALHDVLARQKADPCQPVAAETVLDASYPGGLAALAANWAAFLRDPPASVRAY